MRAKHELLPGAWRITLGAHTDARGSFVKTFSHSALASEGLAFKAAEEYFSVSRRNVVRGMHFQLPPHAHTKLVYCAVGAVRDVLLDLRQGRSYGRIAETLLDAAEPAILLIPEGIAHGFLALRDDSLMVYKTSTEYAPTADAGIAWNSFGHDWRLTASAVLSARDELHPSFNDFQSPF